MLASAANSSTIDFKGISFGGGGSGGPSLIKLHKNTQKSDNEAPRHPPPPRKGGAQLKLSKRKVAMNQKVVPMIHVPDVRATVDWYQSIGFNVVATYGNETRT